MMFWEIYFCLEGEKINAVPFSLLLDDLLFELLGCLLFIKLFISNLGLDLIISAFTMSSP